VCNFFLDALRFSALCRTRFLTNAVVGEYFHTQLGLVCVLVYLQVVGKVYAISLRRRHH